MLRHTESRPQQLSQQIPRYRYGCALRFCWSSAIKNLRAFRTSALASLLLFSHCISTKAAQVGLQERKALASVAGSVGDSQTRHSVAEARVVLQQSRPARPANTNEKCGASVVTDSEGHFRFEAINPGEYTLFVRKLCQFPFLRTGIAGGQADYARHNP